MFYWCWVQNRMYWCCIGLPIPPIYNITITKWGDFFIFFSLPYTSRFWKTKPCPSLAVMTSNFDEITKFQKPARSQEPEDYSGLWNFWKISFLAWVMADTVWSQIGGLFDGFLHHSVLFLVFTVFTSIMYFFLQFPFKPQFVPKELTNTIPLLSLQ